MLNIKRLGLHRRDGTEETFIAMCMETPKRRKFLDQDIDFLVVKNQRLSDGLTKYVPETTHDRNEFRSREKGRSVT